MITLGTKQLHAALEWIDETAWSAVEWKSERTLTGGLVIEQYTKTSGRPITLVGGENFCPITRIDLLELRSYVQSITGTGVVLTLHDGRTFTVIPSTEVIDCIECYPYPIVLNHGSSNPTDDTLYYIAKISLIVI